MSFSHPCHCPPLRILVVENHDDTRQMLDRLLTRGGHSIFEASTMEEALQLLQAQGIDVLLSDIGLPDGDGWELLERAKSLGQFYAIAISGYGTLADKSRSREVGFRHHLVKPFTTDEIDILLMEAADERHPEAPKS
jgi:CheY-like chemotaxis protein